ncbi:monofunctional biosynthetic peptidoglycan transglycosylase [Zoogloea sp.]|jgi:monofunctional biosynthetic peptidoglycan transglycosylase|uniref:monofunctional biosynthetic peptidoglycan transglycosylase n=1 Tax=Zoogloea sp. TaxID=49181 RepID=UPI0011D525DA|nr:monofunctional biosynthetic peptidoglycan transglycosylase [Zoogloea sp.]MBK6656371.1 monofunctional biosynthetic peptidoglycan transglycosylase [Zoogloea sp.]MBK7845960.1 monofunctional biosynthetic peptidoglycan transglycosylase [Zoogloea sp.]MBP7444707.1 monofunctional biosynthetic peptidoglycan transglycosylase [Zoogloea sp.]TXG95732.1 MAG: monofunctional biosynthetic peptidoglycan transglycosylase [Zoogloea sp.]HOY02696.1 monofunctional biosynthetic peptidoglycan transglycosylase [Zoog
MHTLWRWTRRALLALVLVFVAWHVWLLGQVLWWKWVPPSETSFMSLRLDELNEKKPDAELRYRWVPYEQISLHLKRAVVAAEDDKFVDHEGFDWDGIQKAIEKNQKKGKAVAGGSTISQQLAKNLFLSPSRSYFRKAEEAIITVMIEALWDKRRILEVYLNVVEWGNGIFGCEAAAQRYYKTSAARLSPPQAARLAVMLPNPRKYETTFGPRLAAHAARIQGRMHHSEVP